MAAALSSLISGANSEAIDLAGQFAPVIELVIGLSLLMVVVPFIIGLFRGEA